MTPMPPYCPLPMESLVMAGGRMQTKSPVRSSHNAGHPARLAWRLCQNTWPGLFVLSVYILTLAPTVTGEDSGELITAAYYFGVPHPPGYPLWTILCGAFTHIVPIGSVAWRANLFSAVCSAAAVHFMYLALKRMQFKKFCAGIAAATCGLTTVVWSQSVIAEVYALNLLIMAILIWLTVYWHDSQNRKWLLWGALCFGLGMSNHHLLGFAALGLAIWGVAIQVRLLLDWRLAVMCVLLFLIGLLPYFYLVWAAQRDVPVKWGETTNLAGVWEHASRGQYKSDTPVRARIPMTGGLMAARLFYGLRWEVHQFTPLLAPLLLAGLIWLWRRKNRRIWFWWTLTLGFCCGPLFLYISGPQMDRQGQFVQKVFLTPLALASAVPLAAGIRWTMAAWRRFRRRTGTRVYRVAVYATPMAVLAIPLIAHWNNNNMRHYWYAHDHAQNMLACMLPRGILFPSGDHNTFPLIYLIHVENRRPDVTIADKYGYIDLDLYRDMPNNPGKPRTREEREAIEEWIIRTARRPVYFTVKKPSAVENAETVPVGLVYHLLPEGKEFDTSSCWKDIHYQNLDGESAPMDHAASNILSDYYYALGAKAIADNKHDKAHQHFKTSLRYAWGIKEIYNNVASALAEAGRVDEAIAFYEEAARLDWRYGPARWNLAKIFRSLGQIEWSAKVFEDLTQATPGDFRPYGELGFLYANYFNDPWKARHWWYESLRINPRQAQIIQALAENEQPPTKAPSTSTAKPDSSSGHLQLSHETIDLGPVVEGSAPTATLTLRNIGMEPLTGLSVDATCTCVVSDLKTDTLDPSDFVDVLVGLRTEGKRGKVKEALRIKSDNDHGEHVLYLRATVLPEFTTDPDKVRWEILPKQPIESTVVTISNHADRPFSIQKVTSTEPEFQFDWPQQTENVKHVIQVHTPSLFSKPIEGHFEVHTTLADRPVIQIPFSVEFKNPAKVIPKVLYLGYIRRDQNVHRMVHIDTIQEDLELSLRNTGAISGLTTNLHQVGARGSAWLLDVNMEGSQAETGLFEHVLSIEVAGYDQPIEVTLHGHVAE